MRKFLRDVIVRSAEKIRERERATLSLGSTNVLAIDAKYGRASTCMFCGHLSEFEVSAHEARGLVCAEHVGPLITTWMDDREITVVRL